MRRMAALVVLIGLAALRPAAAMDVVVFNPIWSAIAAGDVEKADRTLGTGTDPNITDDAGKTPLIYAALADDPEMVALLARYRARLDYADPLGNTALAYAVTRGNIDAANALVEAGAKVNTENRQGVTPLMIAAGAGRMDMLHLLLDKGADVNVHDFTGRTALEWAQRGNRTMAAAALRKAGAKN